MEKRMDQYTRMTETPVQKLVLQLAAPTVVSMLITSIYNMADTFFVGQISTSASGAVGVVASLMSVIQAIGFMLGHGAGSIISRRLGQRDEAAAQRFASTSFFAALAAGCTLSVVGLSFLTPMMRMLGSTETILPHARAYGGAILLGAPLMMASVVLNNILRYEGKANFAMIGLTAGGILNIVLDPVFIFGLEMGVGGAGLATSVSQGVSFCILLSMFLRGKTVSRISVRHITRDWREFGQILTTGFPSFGRQGLGSIASMLLNLAARGYGDAAVAAMSIVNRVFMFILAVVIGIGQGFQPVASFNYGAHKYQRVKKACLFTAVMGSAALAVVSGCVFALAEPLVTLFRNDPAVVAIAVPALRMQCAAMLLQPTCTAGNMLFQSIGKSGKATFLSCCRQGIFFLPLILTLPGQLGVLGVQISQPIADVLTFFVTAPMLFDFLRRLPADDAPETV